MNRIQSLGTNIAIALLSGTLAIAGCTTSPDTRSEETSAEETSAEVISAEETSVSSLTDSELIPVGDSPIMGNPDAPVTIVEFTSMQCPFCAQGGEIMEALVAHYPDEVRVVFKHFPLSFQSQARPASIAAAAAGEQGMFWEMKSALFQNLNAYGQLPMEELAAGLAEDLGLDVEQFRSDFHDPALAARVDRDHQLGGTLGVRGTPAFFVNGELVAGAQPLPEFISVVNRHLEVVEQLRSEGVADEDIYDMAVKRHH